VRPQAEPATGTAQADEVPRAVVPQDPPGEDSRAGASIGDGSASQFLVDPHKLAYAQHLREAGDTIAEMVAKTGITRSSLYRHLPARPADTVTAAGTEPESR